MSVLDERRVQLRVTNIERYSVYSEAMIKEISKETKKL